jgi:RimJ/RimL family protein N-acetyltransferase
MILPALTTERLLLRPFTTADEAIHDLVYGDPEVAVPFASGVRTREETREWLVCRMVQARVDELGFWALERRDDAALLGLAALQAYVADWIVWPDDPEPRHNRIEVEYSYALGRQFWGHGYVTEAGRAVVDHAFGRLRLPRLAYAVDGANARSIGVMRRLGFRRIENLHPDGADSYLGVLENDRPA